MKRKLLGERVKMKERTSRWAGEGRTDTEAAPERQAPATHSPYRLGSYRETGSAFAPGTSQVSS